MLTYPQSETAEVARRVEITHAEKATRPAETLGLGVLGAGNYANAVFLPAVKNAGGIPRVGIATAKGLTARHAAERFGFQYASSAEEEILQDDRINVVAVLTPHNQHARQVTAALWAGKHVFCEKPLAIHAEELNDIQAALAEAPGLLLMEGFNRRFAPFSVALAGFLAGRSEPLLAHYRVNAGYLPLTHWTQDPAVGGGRIIGEGCHFIDYLTFLVGAAPVAVRVVGLPDGGRYREDNVSMQFRFPDGSVGVLDYLANGDKSFSKERMEVFCGGKVAVLDDFRSLELVHNGQRNQQIARLRQDKGHQAGWQAFIDAVKKGEPAPIPVEQLIGVARATFAALTSLHSGQEEPV